jgi:hypothetical protein
VLEAGEQLHARQAVQAEIAFQLVIQPETLDVAAALAQFAGKSAHDDK